MLTVTFSYAQFRAARHYATPRHVDYFDQAELDGKRRKVTMPVVAWKVLVDRLASVIFTKWGKVNRKALVDTDGVAAPEALAKISKAVAKIEAHPALRGEMVIGMSQERFLVWPGGTRGALWSLTPTYTPFSSATTPSMLEPQFEPRPVVALSNGPTSGNHPAFRFREGITWWKANPVVSGDLVDVQYGW